MADWTLSLENFKSIRSLDKLQGRPLTLLLGPNNAGKTSILQSLLLLKRSLEYSELVLWLQNDWVDLGSYRETVTAGHSEKGIGFEITVQKSVEEMETVRFRVDDREGNLQIRSHESTSVGHREPPGIDPESGELYFVHEVLQIKYQRAQEQIIAVDNRLLKNARLRWFGFLPTVNTIDPEETHDPFFPDPSLEYFWPLLNAWFSKIHYIGPLRSYPERFYSFHPPARYDVGIAGEDTPHFLFANAQKGRLLKSLNHWLGPECFNLISEVRIRELTERPGLFALEVKITDRWVNIRDVGFGLSQLLPILVQSLVMRKEELLLLEQPELHLHPKAQADLGSFLAEMVQEGRQYLIETHSEYLLMRIAAAVKEKIIAPEDVAIYFFALDAEGCTVIKEIPLDAEGRLPSPGEWPTGFFDTTTREAERYLFGPGNPQ